MSAIGNEGSVGGPSAGPVDAAKPLIASTIVPNPGRSRYGPSWPQPDTRAKTRRGISLKKKSPPRPPLSEGPGGKILIKAPAREVRPPQDARPPRLAEVLGPQRVSSTVHFPPSTPPT